MDVPAPSAFQTRDAPPDALSDPDQTLEKLVRGSIFFRGGCGSQRELVAVNGRDQDACSLR